MTTTLLAVDDSKTMRKVLEIAFAGEEEFRTVLAENGRDALGKLQSEQPSVVLIDHALGEDSGYDLCKQVKQAAPGAAVVMLSSKQHPYDNVRGSAAGADDHIDKPFDTQQLIDKISGLARKAAAAPAVQPAAAPAAAPPQQSEVRKPRTETLSYGTPSPGQASPRPAPMRAHTMPGTPAPSAQPVAAPAAPISAPRPPPAVAPAAPKPVAPAAAPPAAPAPAAARTPAAPAPAAPAPAAAAPTPVPAAGKPAAAPASAAAAAVDGKMADRLQGLGLTSEQVEGVLALSREVVEQVVWEVVPDLAETLIREEIARLTRE